MTLITLAAMLAGLMLPGSASSSAWMNQSEANAAPTPATASSATETRSGTLLDLLAERPRLVVIDEAQWLNRAGIEYLRHLHDDLATKFALLLVGGNAAGTCFRASRCLRSRLFRRVPFAPLTPEGVLRLFSTNTKGRHLQADQWHARTATAAW